MSSGESGEPTGRPERAESEEELRAAYEAEIKQIRVEQIVLEQVVTLVNLGMRRTGLQPGTEDERDLGQVQLAIESVRALLPLVEQIAAPDRRARSATRSPSCSSAFVRLGGGPRPGPEPGRRGRRRRARAAGPAGARRPPATCSPASPPSRPPAPGEPGPAQRSGRLWIPGQ